MSTVPEAQRRAPTPWPCLSTTLSFARWSVVTAMGPATSSGASRSAPLLLFPGANMSAHAAESDIICVLCFLFWDQCSLPKAPEAEEGPSAATSAVVPDTTAHRSTRSHDLPYPVLLRRRGLKEGLSSWTVCRLIHSINLSSSWLDPYVCTSWHIFTETLSFQIITARCKFNRILQRRNTFSVQFLGERNAFYEHFPALSSCRVSGWTYLLLVLANYLRSMDKAAQLNECCCLH
jgi:hypothetical protein